MRNQGVAGLIDALYEWNQSARSDHENHFKLLLQFLDCNTGYKDTMLRSMDVNIEGYLYILEEQIVDLISQKKIDEKYLVDSLTQWVSRYFENRARVFTDEDYALEDYDLWKKIVKKHQLVS